MTTCIIAEPKFKAANEELDSLVLSIIKQHGPLRFRQIEAHVVLNWYELSTYSMQISVGRLEEKELIIQEKDFRYRSI